MKRFCLLLCILTMLATLFVGCSQTESVPKSDVEREPEAWLLQQAYKIVQRQASSLSTTTMFTGNEEISQLAKRWQEGVRILSSVDLYIFPSYQPYVELVSAASTDAGADGIALGKAVFTRDPIAVASMLPGLTNISRAVAASSATSEDGFLDLPSILAGKSALLVWHGNGATAVIGFADEGVGLRYHACLLPDWNAIRADALSWLPTGGKRVWKAAALEQQLKLETNVPHTVSRSAAESAREYYQSCTDELLTYAAQHLQNYMNITLAGNQTLLTSVMTNVVPARITLYAGIDDLSFAYSTVSRISEKALSVYNLTLSRYVARCPHAADVSVAVVEFTDGKKAALELTQGEICTTLTYHPLTDESAAALEERFTSKATETIKLK